MSPLGLKVRDEERRTLLHTVARGPATLYQEDETSREKVGSFIEINH